MFNDGVANTTELLPKDSVVIEYYQTPKSKRQGLPREAVVETLSTFPEIKASIPPDATLSDYMSQVMDLFEYRFIPKGSTVYHIDSAPIELFLVLRGTAIAFIRSDHDEAVPEITALHSETLRAMHDFFQTHPEVNRNSIFEMSLELPQPLSVKYLTEEEKLLFSASDKAMNYCEESKFHFKKIDEFSATSSFGITSVIFNSSRSSAVIAASPLHLLKLSGHNYRKYFEYRVEMIMDRMHFMERIISKISRPLTARFCNLFQEKQFSKGELIFGEGSPIDALYIIKEGEVQLFQEIRLKMPENPELPSSRPSTAYKKITNNIALLGPYSVFGDDEIVNGGLRKFSATVLSLRTTLYCISRQTYINFAVKKYNILDVAIKELTETRSSWRTQQENKGSLLNRAEDEISRKESQRQYHQLHGYLNLPQHSLPKRYILGGTNKSKEVSRNSIKAQQPEAEPMRTLIIKQVIDLQKRESKLMNTMINITTVKYHFPAESERERPSPLFKRTVMDEKEYQKKKRLLNWESLKTESRNILNSRVTTTRGEEESPAYPKEGHKNSMPNITQNLSYLPPRNNSLERIVSPRIANFKKLLHPQDASATSMERKGIPAKNVDYYDLQPFSSGGRTRDETNFDRRYSQGSPSQLGSPWSPVIRNNITSGAWKRLDASTNMTRPNISQDGISSPLSSRCCTPTVVNLLESSPYYSLNNLDTATEFSTMLSPSLPQRRMVSSAHNMFRSRPKRGVLLNKYSVKQGSTHAKRR